MTIDREAVKKAIATSKEKFEILKDKNKMVLDTKTFAIEARTELHNTLVDIYHWIT